MLKKLTFIPFPQLRTERLILRRIKTSDKKEIFYLRTDDIVMKFIKRNKLKYLNDANEFINRINIEIKKGKSILWGICYKEHPELIGTICLWNFSKDYRTAEVGYDLNTNYHGQGIMNEAMQTVLKYGFIIKKFEFIEAFTNKKNEKSINLLIKNNFVLTKNRKDKENSSNRIFIKYPNK